MTNAIVPERVTERRQALNMSQAALAKLIGASQQSIDAIERGKVRRSTRLHEIAKALETTPDYLMGQEAERVSPPIPVPPGRLPYGGTVAAGDWLTVDDFNQDMADHVVPVSVPRHPAYPQLEQIAWRVRGDSMDQAGILDGMWLVGASYADYVDRIGELDNGAYVVVERTRYQGAERELTVKEVQFARRGMRLIPRSSNPRHREFFIDLDESADPDVETVRLLGVVLWAGRDLAPGAR